jgi:predicted dehydrogenase
MDKLRLGIAGTGAIVREFHLPIAAQNPRVEVGALWNYRSGSLEELGRRFNVRKLYTDINQFANDADLDAILIASPNNMHAPVAESVLEHGKHVLCEKPMARSVAEAQAMVNAAERADRKLMIAYPWRCDVDFRWLRDVIRAGRLGRVLKLKCHAVVCGDYPSEDSWQSDPEMAGGGVLYDIGIHAIDNIFFLFDDQLPGAKVWARVGNYFTNARVEDTATVLIEFDNGMLAGIDAGWRHNFRVSPHGAIEVFGTEGYGRTFPTQISCRIEGSWSVVTPELHLPREHIDASMYEAQLEAFVDYVLYDQPPTCDGWQGLRDMAVLYAAYESAKTGGPVRVSALVSKMAGQTRP